MRHTLACVAAGLCLPASAGALRVEQLVELADISGLSLSPDGAELAFRVDRADLARNTYQLGWYIIDLRGGEVRFVGDGGEPIHADPGLIRTGQAAWTADQEALLVRRMEGEGIGIWRLSADGSSARPVVTGPADVERMERGGEALFYSLSPPRDAIEDAERKLYDEGILVDAHVDLGQPLSGGWVEGRLAAQRLTGNWFERGGVLWREPRRWFRLDLQTLHSEPVSEGPGPLPLRSPAGGIARLVDERGGTELVVEKPGKKRTFRCRLSSCEGKRLASFAWRPNKEELIVTLKDRSHSSSLYRWNASSGVTNLVTKSEGTISGSRAGDVPCAITGSEAICVEASASSPPRLTAINLDTGFRRHLFDPNSGLRRSLESGPRAVGWNIDGIGEVTGQFFLPPNRDQRPSPLFITYYRCEGFLRGGEGDEWPLAALAASGIAALCINAPPVTGEQDGTSLYEAARRIIGEIIGDLSSQGLIDGGKVGMGGYSFGSEVAMWLATNSRLLAAASIASAQLEPGYYWLNAVRGRSQPDMMRQVWGLGRPDENPDRWKLVSPALKADSIDAPLLMQLPEQEARSVVELYARLSRTSTPVELYAFPDEPHYKIQPRHKLAAYRRNLDWFRYWLKGERDPNPERADQYRRWDELRSRRGRAALASP